MEDTNVVEMNEAVETEQVTVKEKLAIGWQKAKPVVTGIAIGAGALLLMGVLKALGDDIDEETLEEWDREEAALEVEATEVKEDKTK